MTWSMASPEDVARMDQTLAAADEALDQYVWALRQQGQDEHIGPDQALTNLSNMLWADGPPDDSDPDQNVRDNLLIAALWRLSGLGIHAGDLELFMSEEPWQEK